jgi:hypothetical protein
VVATPIDHAKHLEYAGQLARQDYEAKSDDIGWIQYFSGSYLPVEQEEQDRLNTAQAEAAVRIDQARSQASVLANTASVSLVATGASIPGGRLTTTLQSEEQAVAEVARHVADAEADRTECERILRGEAPDPDGIMWIGHVPPRATPDTTHRKIRWSAANVRDRALTFVPYIVLGGIDLFIILSNLKDHLRTDSYLLPLVMSIALAAGQIWLPSVLGRRLAEWFHRGSVLAREVVLFLVGLVVWLACISVVTWFRVDADETTAVRKAADASQVPLSSVNPDDVYNWWGSFFLWAVPVGVIGVIVMFLLVLFHNPVISQTLKIDHRLVNLYRERAVHQTVLEKGQACVTATLQACEDTVSELRHARDEVLPKQSAEFCQRYRRCLDLEYKNPDVTMALFPLTGKGGRASFGHDEKVSPTVEPEADVIDGEIVE